MPTPVIDLASNKTTALFFPPYVEEQTVKSFAAWLRENKLQTVRLYSATPVEEGEKILAKGLPSSTSLYVFPSQAGFDASVKYPQTPIDVYPVEISIALLRASPHMLAGQRMQNPAKEIGSSLAESLVHAHGCLPKGNLLPYNIRFSFPYELIERGLKYEEFVDIANLAGELDTRSATKMAADCDISKKPTDLILAYIFSRHTSQEVRAAIASNDATPDSLLLRMFIREPYGEIPQLIAQNPSVSKETRYRLSHSKDTKVLDALREGWQGDKRDTFSTSQNLESAQTQTGVKI